MPGYIIVTELLQKPWTRYALRSTSQLLSRTGEKASMSGLKFTQIRSTILLFAVCALGVFGAAPLRAQFVESIEVRINSIDVVVTDRSGKPVHGLGRDDFEVLEDGKLRTVTNFYEILDTTRPELTVQSAGVTQPVAAPEENAEARRRKVLIFVDNYSTHPFKRQVVFDALQKSIDRIVRPGDEAMVVSWDRRLRVLTQFTDDVSSIRAALKKLEAQGGGQDLATSARLAKMKLQMILERQQSQTSRHMSRTPPSVDLNELQSVIRAHADEVSLNAKLLISATHTMLSTLGGVEGKKVMIFAGAHLPENPSLELYEWLHQRLGGTLDGISQLPIAQASDHSLLHEIRALGDSANANGVTMYMVDTADPDGDRQSEEPYNPAISFAEFSNTAMAYQTLARVTGGIAITGAKNFDSAIETVANDLGSYYSIGYRAADGDHGRHEVVVRPKNRDYRARARNTLVARTNDEQMSDRVRANIYRPNGMGDVAVTISAGKPQKESRGIYRVPVTITMPSSLTLLREGNDLVGGFDIFVAVGDDSGATSDVTKVPQPVRIPAAAEKQFRARSIVWTTDLLVRKGGSHLSAVVVDRLSNSAGSAQLELDIH
jgi:VWFA-related protein